MTAFCGILRTWKILENNVPFFKGKVPVELIVVELHLPASGASTPVPPRMLWGHGNVLDKDSSNNPWLALVAWFNRLLQVDYWD